MAHYFYYDNPPYYQSYATHSNCTPLGHGSFRWCGDAGNDTTKCETGTSCKDARQTFCNRHGPGGGKCYGDPGAPRSSQQKGIPTHQKGVRPLGGSLKSNILTGGGNDSLVGPTVDNAARRFFQGNTAPPSKNPASQCDNCGNDWWNPGQWACQIKKAGCEAASAAGKGFGGIPWTLIAIGGGGLLLLLILLRR